MNPPALIAAELSWVAMVILGAGANVAIAEGATPEQLQILWCLIGGFMGSMCSLRFFQVKGWWENAAQLGVNILLSATAAPVLCDYAARWSGFPNGLRLAILVSAGTGIFGQQTVMQAIPLIQKVAARRLRRTAKWLAGENPNDDSNDSTTPPKPIEGL